MVGKASMRAAIATSAVIFVAGCASPDARKAEAPFETRNEGRQFYSPNFRSDPQLQAKWDAAVRRLEAECESSGRYCTEAKNARLALQRLPRQ